MTKFRVRETHDGYGDSITIINDNGSPIMRMWDGLDSDGAKRACDALNAYEDAARIIAQRDRLAQCLKYAKDSLQYDDGNDRMLFVKRIESLLSELDKEKQS